MPDRGRDPEGQQPALRRLALGVLAQHLGVVLAREAQLPEPLVHVVHHRRPGRGPSRSCRRRCGASRPRARSGSASTRCARRRRRPGARGRRRACRGAGRGCSARRAGRSASSTRSRRRPCRRRADVGDLLARDDHRRLPADVAGLQAVARRLLEVRLDAAPAARRPGARRAQVDHAVDARAARRAPARPCRAGRSGRGRRSARRPPRSTPVSTSSMRSLQVGLQSRKRPG